MSDWRTQLPEILGPLPLGGQLRRTDAGGPADARIAVLGVYPAATKLAGWKHEGSVFQLPVEVERTSFEAGSKSGRDLERNYLAPLGLSRADVLVADVYPYYLATTAKGTNGRTMARNVERYEAVAGKTAVQQRPIPDELLRQARELQGNRERLAEIFGHPDLRLVITLGAEAAAFVRGQDRAREAQEGLYGEPAKVRFAERLLRVVHLTHPGNLMRRESAWHERHRNWCEEDGRKLVAEILSG